MACAGIICPIRGRGMTSNNVVARTRERFAHGPGPGRCLGPKFAEKAGSGRAGPGRVGSNRILQLPVLPVPTFTAAEY